MPKIDRDALKDSMEDAVEDLIARGYSQEVAIRAFARSAEAVDDVVPFIDKLLDEEDYEDIGTLLAGLMSDPARKARRLERREARKAFVPARIAHYIAAGRSKLGASWRAYRDWRKHWRSL